MDETILFFFFKIIQLPGGSLAREERCSDPENMTFSVNPAPHSVQDNIIEILKCCHWLRRSSVSLRKWKVKMVVRNFRKHLEAAGLGFRN